MKFIKDKNLITQEYCERLSDWILNNQAVFFADENFAVDWHDFEYWPDIKSDRKHLIMSGEVCIVDREWQDRHAYVVCLFYGKKRKIKDLFKVINVDKLDRANWRNGYFLIPDIRLTPPTDRQTDKGEV